MVRRINVLTWCVRIMLCLFAGTIWGTPCLGERRTSRYRQPVCDGCEECNCVWIWWDWVARRFVHKKQCLLCCQCRRSCCAKFEQPIAISCFKFVWNCRENVVDGTESDFSSRAITPLIISRCKIARILPMVNLIPWTCLTIYWASKPPGIKSKSRYGSSIFYRLLIRLKILDLLR